MAKFTPIGRNFPKTVKRDSFMFIIGLTYVMIALFCFLILFCAMKNASSSEACRDTLGPLESDIETLKMENIKLRKIIGDLNSRNDALLAQAKGSQYKFPEPSEEYEKHRKRMEYAAKYFWYYFQNKFRSLQAGHTLDRNLLDDLFKSTYDFKLIVQSSLMAMKQHDGFNKWRRREASQLGNLVQKRLMFLQNPVKCETPLKATCHLNTDNCAFGCQLHHVAECLAVAYGTQRLLVLNTTGFAYDSEGFSKIYQPMSDTCTELAAGESSVTLTSQNLQSSIKVLAIGETNELREVYPRPKFLPAAVPADLLPRIQKLNGNPHAWWLGQLKKFIMRMLPDVHDSIQEEIQKIGFRKPIVGVQIRRTDKVIEAGTFTVDHYMTHVEEYFDMMEIIKPIDKRRIYLASEDPDVIDEVKKKYPKYEVLSNKAAAEKGKNARYTHDSLLGIMADIKILSMCDYLVGTFSSNVGRISYELMQTLNPDASLNAVSMDRHHYSVYQNLAKFRAFLAHHNSGNISELMMEVGDIVEVNHYTDSTNYTMGRSNRSKDWHKIAEFKLEALPEAVDFPLYKNVV